MLAAGRFLRQPLLDQVRLHMEVAKRGVVPLTVINLDQDMNITTEPVAFKNAC